MKQVLGNCRRLPDAARLGFGLLVGVLLGVVAACSSSGNPAPSGACDQSNCIQGNQCLSDGKTTQCRLVCQAQTDCPFNYKCASNPNAAVPFCVPDTYTFPQGTPGQWGD